jgi:hypothetical protein
MNKENDKNGVEKLIEFFKTLKQKEPGPDLADYSSWEQTEDAYQKEQAEWLEKINQKKLKKQQLDK